MSEDEDVLQLGNHRSRRVRPWIIAAAAVVVLIGAALGWQLLGRPARSSAPNSLTSPSSASAVFGSRASLAPTASPTLPSSVPAAVGTLVDNGNRCAAQRGKGLQLGIEFTNGYSIPVLVTEIRVEVPLGALHETGTAFTECRPGARAISPHVIDTGESLWVSATFDVEVGCPAFAPVLFAIDYVVGAQRLATVPSGFPDLGQVTYSGCASSTPSSS